MEKNKNMKSQKGFSLIELLVVIAIMGILATIALAALNSARTKSADAAVKTELNNLKAQAEVYYDPLGYYNTDGKTAISTGAIPANCPASGMFANSVVLNMIANIKKNINQDITVSRVSCSTDDLGQKWAVSVSSLRGGDSWCVDNQGFNKVGTDSGGSCS